MGSVFKVNETIVLTPGSESEGPIVMSVRSETRKGGAVMLVWKCCVLHSSLVSGQAQSAGAKPVSPTREMNCAGR